MLTCMCVSIFVCVCVSTAHLRPPKCCVKQKSRENVETRSRQGFHLMARGGEGCWQGPVKLRRLPGCKGCAHTHAYTHTQTGSAKGYIIFMISVSNLLIYSASRIRIILFVVDGVVCLPFCLSAFAFAASFAALVPFALNFIQLSDLFVSQNKKEL